MPAKTGAPFKYFFQTGHKICYSTWLLEIFGLARKFFQSWFFLCVLFFYFQFNLSGQSDYYPLNSGTQFVYQVKATQKSSSSLPQEQLLSAMIMHLGPASVQGKTVIPEGRYIDGKLAGVTFVADDETGIYYFANQNSTQKKPVVMNPIQYLIKYPVQTGARWKQQSSGFEMVNDRKLPIMLNASIVSDAEIVSVPAGVFAKCLKVEMTGKLPSMNGGPEFRISNELWYAPGLGMIKQVQTEERLLSAPSSFTMVLNLQKVVYGE
jgi:hypothetical protein